MGGDLAQIRTVKDQATVVKYLQDNFSSGTNEWWIGAKRDGSKKRKWKWVNGDKVSTDIPYNWDKSGLGHMAEKCFSIHSTADGDEDEFCAVDCPNANEFVCERYYSLEGIV